MARGVKAGRTRALKLTGYAMVGIVSRFWALGARALPSLYIFIIIICAAHRFGLSGARIVHVYVLVYMYMCICV